MPLDVLAAYPMLLYTFSADVGCLFDDAVTVVGCLFYALLHVSTALLQGDLRIAGGQIIARAWTMYEGLVPFTMGCTGPSGTFCSRSIDAYGNTVLKQCQYFQNFQIPPGTYTPAGVAVDDGVDFCSNNGGVALQRVYGACNRWDPWFNSDAKRPLACYYRNKQQQAPSPPPSPPSGGSGSSSSSTGVNQSSRHGPAAHLLLLLLGAAAMNLVMHAC